jgi:hypothetical protein
VFGSCGSAYVYLQFALPALRIIAVQDKSQVLKDVTGIISDQLGMEEGEV